MSSRCGRGSRCGCGDAFLRAVDVNPVRHDWRLNYVRLLAGDGQAGSATGCRSRYSRNAVRGSAEKAGGEAQLALLGVLAGLRGRVERGATHRPCQCLAAVPCGTLRRAGQWWIPASGSSGFQPRRTSSCPARGCTSSSSLLSSFGPGAWGGRASRGRPGRVWLGAAAHRTPPRRRQRSWSRPLGPHRACSLRVPTSTPCHQCTTQVTCGRHR